jgi:hypothetical protein
MSARNTGASIRPMMGSVFAPPFQAGAREALEVHEEVVSREPPKHSVAPRPEKQRSFDDQRSDRPDADEPYSYKPDSEAVEQTVRIAPIKTETPSPIASFKPLVERTSPEELERAAVHFADVTRRPAVSEDAEAGGHPHPRPEATEQKVVITSLLPLLRDQNHREVSQLAAARPGRRDPAGLPARSERSARQQDEIHINIGRIEVTAAPPAPVRATPKPQPGSLDLAAYLKRRDGSVR